MFPFSWNARPWTTPKATTTMDPGIPSLLNPMASAGLPLPGIGGFLSGCDPTVQHRANQVQQQAQPQAQNNRTLFWVNNCSTCLFSQLHLIHTSTRLRQIHLYLYLHSQLLWNIHLQLLHLQRLMDCSEMLNRIQEGLKQEINKAMMSSRPLIVQNPNLPLPNQLLPCNHHRSQLQRPDPTHLFNMPFQVLHIALLSHADLPINPAMSLVVSLPGPGSLCNIHQSLTSTQCQDVAALVGSRPAGPSRLPGTFHDLPLVVVIVHRDPHLIALEANDLCAFGPGLVNIVRKILVNVYIFMQLHLLRNPLQPTHIHLQNPQSNPNLTNTPNIGIQIHKHHAGNPKLTRKMHLSRSSSNVPRLPSFLEMLQNPHVLLTFDKVHNPLPLPRETTSEPPKVGRTCGALYILTSKFASRHNGVHFFDISTSKSGPYMVCFVHFDLDMCFAPQRHALFRHRNFQKWSEPLVFFNILTF